jgi:hypothetical protein
MYGHLEYFKSNAVGAERKLYADLRDRGDIDDVELNRIGFGLDLIESGRRAIVEGKTLEDDSD